MTRLQRVWEPIWIGSVEIRNRLFVSGHTTNFASENLPTDRHVAYHRERARGGVGLIITEALRVHSTSLGRSSTIAGYLPEVVPGYRAIVDAVRAEGARIFAQLEHSGRHAAGIWARTAPWGPSAIPWASGALVPHAMTRAEIDEMVEAFRVGARHALAAGFDGVEVHLGHGHLLNQFLSPASNVRTDTYGGSEENRLRFPLAVLRAVRETVGPGYTMGVRISADEFLPGGLTLDDMTRLTRAIVDREPVQFVNVSHSHYHGSFSLATQMADMSFPTAPFLDLPRRIKEAVPEVPVFAIGRIDDLPTAEGVLREGIADLVGMTRAHIADPEIVRKGLEGRLDAIRPCIACNQGCIGMIEQSVPMTCVVNPEVGLEREWGRDTWAPSRTPLRVLVVGGGPAGLAAARAAALRGHRVELWERSNRLGGLLSLAASMRGRERLGLAHGFLIRELGRLAVPVRLGREATVDQIMAEGVERVVVATGSRWQPAPIPGLRRVLSIPEAMANLDRLGDQVVVKDATGGWPGAATAEHLARTGRRVALVTSLGGLAPNVTLYSRLALARRLAELRVKVHPMRTILRMEGSRLVLADVLLGDEEQLPDITDVVSADEQVSEAHLQVELERSGVACEVVGDALAPRTALEAIFEGYRAGRFADQRGRAAAGGRAPTVDAA